VSRPRAAPHPRRGERGSAFSIRFRSSTPTACACRVDRSSPRPESPRPLYSTFRARTTSPSPTSTGRRPVARAAPGRAAAVLIHGPGSSACSTPCSRSASRRLHGCAFINTAAESGQTAFSCAQREHKAAVRAWCATTAAQAERVTRRHSRERSPAVDGALRRVCSTETRPPPAARRRAALVETHCRADRSRYEAPASQPPKRLPPPVAASRDPRSRSRRRSARGRCRASRVLADGRPAGWPDAARLRNAGCASTW